VKRLAPLLVLALLAGCGSPPADLFVVQRTGTGANARLTLLVQDDGYVVCNRGKARAIPNARLLAARQLARDLEPQAQLHVELPPGPRSVLSYRVRLQAGTVAFSDTSRPLPPAFARLTAFTADVSEDVCGVNRRG
jgi:hypothetical protein